MSEIRNLAEVATASSAQGMPSLLAAISLDVTQQDLAAFRTIIICISEAKGTVLCISILLNC